MEGGSGMLIADIGWMRGHGRKKLCPKLRHEVINAYRPHGWLPCFVQPLIGKWRKRFKFIEVIVENQPCCQDEELVSIKEAVERHKCKVTHELPIINGFAGRVNLNALSELAAHPGVKKIWLDRDVHAVLDVASPVLGAPESWDLGYSGDGVTVAVIDTGIYPHPDLTRPNNRLVAFRDFVKNKTDFYDDNGHGTHVAGCIAGNGYGSGGKYKGTAPGAKLVGIKVLDRLGSGKLSQVIAGIQWCIEQQEKLGIRVINLSLGSSAQNGYQDDPVCGAVEKAWQAGIVVVAAAGNEGPEQGTVSSPGIDPTIITVGATDDKNNVPKNDDIIAEFSSRGPTVDGLAKPDVVAPGVNIISLAAPGSLLYKQMKKNRVGTAYLSMSGTSMATPLCAGVVALILQAFPRLVPDQVKALITGTAKPLSHSRSDEGAGYVDALSCVQSLKVEEGQ